MPDERYQFLLLVTEGKAKPADLEVQAKNAWAEEVAPLTPEEAEEHFNMLMRGIVVAGQELALTVTGWQAHLQVAIPLLYSMTLSPTAQLDLETYVKCAKRRTRQALSNSQAPA